MLRFAIPEYRLPKSVLRLELESHRAVGVKMVLNTRVGEDLSLNDLAEPFRLGFSSIGTWKESWVYLPRNGAEGRLSRAAVSGNGLQGESVPAGSTKVMVIGGGNAAIDSARTSRRMGAECDGCLSSRAQGHAGDRRRDSSRGGGGQSRFLFLSAPHRVMGARQGQRQALRSSRRTLANMTNRAAAAHSHRRGASP